MSFAAMLTATVKKPLSREIIEQTNSAVERAAWNAKRIALMVKIEDELRYLCRISGRSDLSVFIKDPMYITIGAESYRVEFTRKAGPWIAIVGNYGEKRRFGGTVNGFDPEKVAQHILSLYEAAKLAQKHREERRTREELTEALHLTVKTDNGIDRWSDTVTSCSPSAVRLKLVCNADQAKQLIDLARSLGITVS